MLARAGRGIVFSRTRRRRRGRSSKTIPGSAPADRLIAPDARCWRCSPRDDGRGSIAGPGADRRQVDSPDRARIERVLDHIHAHYRERIAIETLADVAALSASGFHRLFRRHTRLTVSDYVAELRIGQACALLVNSQPADRPYRRRGRLRQPRQLQSPVPGAEEVTPREFRRSFRR